MQACPRSFRLQQIVLAPASRSARVIKGLHELLAAGASSGIDSQILIQTFSLPNRCCSGLLVDSRGALRPAARDTPELQR